MQRSRTPTDQSYILACLRTAARVPPVHTVRQAPRHTCVNTCASSRCGLSRPSAARCCSYARTAALRLGAEGEDTCDSQSDLGAPAQGAVRMVVRAS